LSDVLTNDYGLNLTGWHLTEANDISADGQTIVGGGFDPNGNFEGWIASLAPASVPVPSTLVMSSILLGMFGMVWSYRRLKPNATAV
jgi:hypothetical protein